MKRVLVGALCGFSLVAVGAELSPYAGQQHREIKALSPQEQADLLEGKGMGYAKAAELNGYPGPAHVLELAEPLNLTPAQRSDTQRLFDDMQARAKALGGQLVEAERGLDALFASRDVSSANLEDAVMRIGVLQAQLRAVHLDTHLGQLRVLSPEQVARYAALRGYGAATPQEGGHPHRQGH